MATAFLKGAAGHAPKLQKEAYSLRKSVWTDLGPMVKSVSGKALTSAEKVGAPSKGDPVKVKKTAPRIGKK